MHDNDIFKIQYNQASCNNVRQFKCGQMSSPNFKAKLSKNAEKQISEEALKIASAAIAASGIAKLTLFRMNSKKKIFDHDALAQEIQRQLDEDTYYKVICKNLGMWI